VDGRTGEGWGGKGKDGIRFVAGRICCYNNSIGSSYGNYLSMFVYGL